MSRCPRVLSALLSFAAPALLCCGGLDRGTPASSHAIDAADGVEAAATPDATRVPACEPGSTVACVGPGGCASTQVCLSGGDAYGLCECPGDDGGPAFDATAPGDGSLPPFDAGDALPTGVGAILSPGSHASLAAPLPSGCGITWDGRELWLLARSGNPLPYTLVRFDPNTGVADRTFTLTSLFAPQGGGTNAGGITWDGTSIWISVTGDSNALVTVDP